MLQQQENGWTHVVYRQAMLGGVGRTTLSTNAKLNRGLGQQHQRKGKLREVVSFSGPGKQTWFIPSAVVCVAHPIQPWYTKCGPLQPWCTPEMVHPTSRGPPHQPWTKSGPLYESWSTPQWFRSGSQAPVLAPLRLQFWLPPNFNSGFPRSKYGSPVL